MQTSGKITVAELRRLLFELKALHPETRCRFRIMGELWQQQYYHIALLTEKGIALSNDQRKLVVIPDLARVMQFELEDTFQQYQRHFHYSVEEDKAS